MRRVPAAPVRRYKALEPGASWDIPFFFPVHLSVIGRGKMRRPQSRPGDRALRLHRKIFLCLLLPRGTTLGIYGWLLSLPVARWRTRIPKPSRWPVCRRAYSPTGRSTYVAKRKAGLEKRRDAGETPNKKYQGTARKVFRSFTHTWQGSIGLATLLSKPQENLGLQDGAERSARTF